VHEVGTGTGPIVGVGAGRVDEFVDEVLVGGSSGVEEPGGTVTARAVKPKDSVVRKCEIFIVSLMSGSCARSITLVCKLFLQSVQFIGVKYRACRGLCCQLISSSRFFFLCKPFIDKARSRHASRALTPPLLNNRFDLISSGNMETPQPLSR
jgi:hypothetical protein